MRLIILIVILAILSIMVLVGPARKMQNRASAKNVHSQQRAAVSVNDATLIEGNSGSSNMVFTVTVTGSHTNTVGVNYSTADGTATAGADYTATSGQLVFPGTNDTTTCDRPITKCDFDH